ncbi:MAG: B12-binding domain-containing radical SAM protein [Ruminococcaceae bacterium]|nr:B12-binding domain-containing radical SAM protein [Oscillospiraceae bacterium]
MRTVLFYPRIENSYLPSYAPLGLISIATFLNNNGHETVICDRFFNEEKVELILTKNKPDMVGVSVISNEFIEDAVVISKAAREYGVPVIWGGPLASFISQEILESGYADYVSINEGEFTWLELAEAFKNKRTFDDIKGLAYLKSGEYIQTEKREFMDLSVLPSLDWSLVDAEKYFQINYGFDNMLTTYNSKGCTGSCTFCYNHLFHSSTRRKRPISVVIEEMRCLVEEKGAGGFEFTDDLLFANEDEVIEFCNALIDSELNTCWSGFMRVDVVNNLATYELMYKSGCRTLKYGLESGSERVLKSIGKKIKCDNIERNICFCREAGITPIAMFIFGLPGEAEEDIKKTIELAQKIKSKGAVLGLSFYTPVPGTVMYKQLVEKGKITPLKTLDEYSKISFGEQLSVNVSEISSKELKIIKLYFRLVGLTTQTDNSPGEQLNKLIKNTLKSMSGRGAVHFLKSGFFTAYRLAESLTVFCHPKIRKKYGLYFKAQNIKS